jgi:hypothetical protein
VLLPSDSEETNQTASLSVTPHSMNSNSCSPACPGMIGPAGSPVYDQAADQCNGM